MNQLNFKSFTITYHLTLSAFLRNHELIKEEVMQQCGLKMINPGGTRFYMKFILVM
jgi:hypothetical protein